MIIAHGVPARGAQWFNMDIDMEIHVGGKAPYQVNNQYLVPNGATLGPGVRLPIKVDRMDPAKIAIDWERGPEGARAGRGPLRRRRLRRPPARPPRPLHRAAATP